MEMEKNSNDVSCSLTTMAKLVLRTVASLPHPADIGDRIERLGKELNDHPLDMRPEHEKLRFLQRLIETVQYCVPVSELENLAQLVRDLVLMSRGLFSEVETDGQSAIAMTSAEY